MRDLEVFCSSAEIHAHVRSLWQTDTFRASHDDPCGYIRNWVSRFAGIPRAFFCMTDRRVEHPHFAPWFGALHYRSYPKPAVHDCFILHEMAHAATLADTYNPSSSFETWAVRMAENERRVALESEVIVYWELPGLRAQTFDFEIWADRFLRSPMPGRDVLFAERTRAMRDPRDPIEAQMAGYPSQNRAWAEIWRARYREVESAMARLVDESAVNRELAGAHYRDWLLNHTGMTPERPYPFPDEAEAFAGVYLTTKARVGSPDTGSGDCDAPGTPPAGRATR